MMLCDGFRASMTQGAIQDGLSQAEDLTMPRISTERGLTKWSSDPPGWVDLNGQFSRKNEWKNT